jgi:uncharacterized protein YaeQ
VGGGRGPRGPPRRLRNLTVLSVDPAAVRELGAYAQRSMTLHVSIDEEAVLVSSGTDSMTMHVEQWHAHMDSTPSPRS